MMILRFESAKRDDCYGNMCEAGIEQVAGDGTLKSRYISKDFIKCNSRRRSVRHKGGFLRLVGSSYLPPSYRTTSYNVPFANLFLFPPYLFFIYKNEQRIPGRAYNRNYNSNFNL